MDEIAAEAAVSKQTVYTHFADKEQLFTELIRGNTEIAERFVETMLPVVADSADVESALRALCRRYLVAVIQPQVLQLRRLIVAESSRFPDLACEYYERVPERVTAALAERLRELADRGLLRVQDPVLAARHLAWLVLGIPLDRAMFCRNEGDYSRAELEALADQGVRVFVAAYSSPDRPGT
jgi:TetR/AcrR family transcriptional repressor of mexJK operon